MKPTAPVRKLQSDYSIVQAGRKRQKWPKFDFLIVISGGRSYLLSQTNQVENVFKSKKNFLSKKFTQTRHFFFFLLHSVISETWLQIYECA